MRKRKRKRKWNGVEYNTEIELIVKRLQQSTLSQPFESDRKDILESPLNVRIFAAAKVLKSRGSASY